MVSGQSIRGCGMESFDEDYILHRAVIIYTYLYNYIFIYIHKYMGMYILFISIYSICMYNLRSSCKGRGKTV